MSQSAFPIIAVAHLLLIVIGVAVLVVALTVGSMFARYATGSHERKRLRWLAQFEEAFTRIAAGEGAQRRRALEEVEVLLSKRNVELAASRVGLLDPEGRRDVTRLIEKKGYVDSYIRMSGSPFKWKRARAVKVLGQLVPPRANPVLIRAVNDGDSDIRHFAAAAVSKVRTPEAERALMETLGKGTEYLSYQIAAMFAEEGVADRKSLIEKLHSVHASERRWAAEVITGLRDFSAVPPLLAMLEDESPDARAAAAKALGALGRERDAGRIGALLENDSVWFVRTQAARALGRIASSQSIGLLCAGLRDESWWVRRRCLESLVAIGDQATPALNGVSSWDDRFARESSVEALERLGVESPSGTMGPAGS
jgi:HEAT repeat protein